MISAAAQEAGNMSSIRPAWNRKVQTERILSADRMMSADSVLVNNFEGVFISFSYVLIAKCRHTGIIIL